MQGACLAQGIKAASFYSFPNRFSTPEFNRLWALLVYQIYPPFGPNAGKSFPSFRWAILEKVGWFLCLISRSFLCSTHWPKVSVFDNLVMRFNIYSFSRKHKLHAAACEQHGKQTIKNKTSYKRVLLATLHSQSSLHLQLPINSLRLTFSLSRSQNTGPVCFLIIIVVPHNRSQGCVPDLR